MPETPEIARESNVEFVTRLMEEGSPMCQLVVIEALTKYTGRVLANEIEAAGSADARRPDGDHLLGEGPGESLVRDPW